MLDYLIESDPDILGGKPVVRGTRIPIDLLFELVSIGYTIDEIMDQYPTLDRDVLVKIICLGKDIQERVGKVNLKEYLSKELAH
ncbi:MAG: DUF433 domain-containing protein [Candidatus Hodarchaeota archaeon]